MTGPVDRQEGVWVSGRGDMSRVARRFESRSISEQGWLLDNTWCEFCGMYDLGMLDPEEYELDGRVFIEGRCRVCGRDLKSEIVDQRGGEARMLSSLDRNERLQLMKFVCSFAWADLEIRAEEREFVARLIKRLEMDEEEARQVESWLRLPPNPESIDPTLIPPEHRRLFVAEIHGVIEADGEIAEKERENLELLKQLLP